LSQPQSYEYDDFSSLLPATSASAGRAQFSHCIPGDSLPNQLGPFGRIFSSVDVFPSTDREAECGDTTRRMVLKRIKKKKLSSMAIF
jgi:hypothetical protein